jgi:hypothetical protein
VFFLLISGFHLDVNELCTLLGCYAAYSGNSLATFRENVSVPKRQYSATLQRCIKSQKSADLHRFFFLAKSKQKRNVLYEVTGIYIREGRTNTGHLVSLASNYVMYGDSNILSVYFF